MLKQEGLGLLIIIVFLYSSLFFFQNVIEHLILNNHLIQEWKLYQNEKKEMHHLAKHLILEFTSEKANLAYHNAQTFDYSWQYLGEYKCIVICRPKCVGTKHWLLELKSKRRCMHWRVALADSNLSCESDDVLKLTHNVMYYRMVRNFIVTKE